MNGLPSTNQYLELNFKKFRNSLYFHDFSKPLIFQLIFHWFKRSGGRGQQKSSLGGPPLQSFSVDRGRARAIMVMILMMMMVMMMIMMMMMMMIMMMMRMMMLMMMIDD